MHAITCAVVIASIWLPSIAARSFYIENDRFVADGEPVQIIAGCIHYFRIPRPYWRDRLLKLKAMGLNSIEMYVAWNFHERRPGQYHFDNEADVEAFIQEAADLHLMVLLRPGPYICAEWDFGGLPWWLASSETMGGRTMELRSDDADYLLYVERWWSVLFKRIKPLLYSNGGPVVMVQVENEYGYCSGSWGPDRALVYLRRLVGIARRELGDEVVLYTTDPPNQVERGTIPGDEVFTAVDFGPGWYQLDDAFGTQAEYNPPGKSPPICTEFYTGWLTHWTEKMANTSADSLVEWYTKLLTYRNNSGSVSFYMAHGGTNFGFWAGANVGDTYQPHTTSYDYDCPVSEAGGYGQPGIGGANKYQLLREVVQKLYPDKQLPDVPPASHTANYGSVHLQQGPLLLDLSGSSSIAGNGGVVADVPDIMEEYGQSSGLILYRTIVPLSAFSPYGMLRLAVHDYAKVFLNGSLAGAISRNGLASTGKASSNDAELQDVKLSIFTEQQLAAAPNDVQLVLDVLVAAMGRSNFGCDWDLKGIVNPLVTLNGVPLHDWVVTPLALHAIKPNDIRAQHDIIQQARPVINMTTQHCTQTSSQAVSMTDPLKPPINGLHGPRVASADGLSLLATECESTAAVLQQGPVFLLGSFDVPEGSASGPHSNSGFPADTFLDTPGFSKGIAWVNGFNLGWYWPAVGPQMRLYVPGTLLHEGSNDVILLEMDTVPDGMQVELVDAPDFFGPRSVTTTVTVQ